MSPRRVLIAIAAGAAGLALGVLPALARDAPVTAGAGGYNTFSPATVTIAPGDSVSWSNAGGIHNVHFEDGQFDQPAAPSAVWTPATVSRTFPAAGEYAYYCEQHGAAGGTGMSGKVVVVAPATATSGTTTATTTTTTGTGTTPTIPTGFGPAPATFTVRPARSAFCNRRSKHCTKPGVLLDIKLNDDFEELRGTLRRRPLTGTGSPKAFGTIRVVARAGRHTYRFQEVTSGKRIPKGRYTLALHSTEGGSTAPAVAFRVTS